MKSARGPIHDNRFVRVMFHLLAWGGIAIVYYLVFSLLFDTPAEFRLRASTSVLQQQYDKLNERYDSLVAVLENVAERDKNVFRVLFESDPPSFEGAAGDQVWLTRERLSGMTNRQLGREFFEKLARLDADTEHLGGIYARVQQRVEEMGDGVNSIPSIQPIINHDLTLLTASYGTRIHPFYRNLQYHGGVDYTVPEGTPVFATADGTVRNVTQSSTGSGLTVTISHSGGYETLYSHLSRSSVRSGDRVRRGDIIARTGDTGMSLSPHLHYEVRKDGMRQDPIHYFFMELTPAEYQRIVRIAGSGMQSFD